MNKIKFSHRYQKLPLQIKTAVLLSAQVVLLEELPKDFIEYDTIYGSGENDYYKLPEKGAYILLLLWGGGKLFTTLRRYTVDKLLYYARITGEIVEIELSGL